MNPAGPENPICANPTPLQSRGVIEMPEINHPHQKRDHPYRYTSQNFSVGCFWLFRPQFLGHLNISAGSGEILRRKTGTGYVIPEYKLMGLAPNGDPMYVDLICDELIDLKEDASFRVDMKYFISISILRGRFPTRVDKRAAYCLLFCFTGQTTKGCIQWDPDMNTCSSPSGSEELNSRTVWRWHRHPQTWRTGKGE
jgi:hypothetical protein